MLPIQQRAHSASAGLIISLHAGMSAQWLQSCPTLWTVVCQTPLSMGLYPAKNTGVSCHSLLQGFFLTQGSNLHLLSLRHCRPVLHCWATRKPTSLYGISICSFVLLRWVLEYSGTLSAFSISDSTGRESCPSTEEWVLPGGPCFSLATWATCYSWGTAVHCWSWSCPVFSLGE